MIATTLRTIVNSIPSRTPFNPRSEVWVSQIFTSLEDIKWLAEKRTAVPAGKYKDGMASCYEGWQKAIQTKPLK